MNNKEIIQPLNLPKGLVLPNGEFHSLEEPSVTENSRFKFTEESVRTLTMIFVVSNKKYSEALFQVNSLAKQGQVGIPVLNNLSNTLAVLSLLEEVSLITNNSYKPNTNSVFYPFVQVIRDAFKEAKKLRKQMKEVVEDEMKEQLTKEKK